MGSQVIVLNGGSSAGKTTTARAMQELSPTPLLRIGIDVRGLARGTRDAVHAGIAYDLPIDTSAMAPAAAAEEILTAAVAI